MLVENLRPGAVRRLGLGYEVVKQSRPDIVYVSMGMYGSEGPLAWQTGYAPCFAALGGVSLLVGYDRESPSGMNVRYADSTFGAAAAYAATVALLHRRRTGAGQFIDVSAVEAMASMIGDELVGHAMGKPMQAAGNRHPDMAPHGVYPCREGEWISLAASSDAVWAALAAAIGQPALADDARFADLPARKANEAELDRLIGAWTATRDAAEAAALLQQHGVAAAKSQSSVDLVSDPHLWARGFYRELRMSDGGTKVTVGPSWKMSREAAIEDGAPRLGEHNAYVFGELLGLSDAEQARLAESGVAR